MFMIVLVYLSFVFYILLMRTYYVFGFHNAREIREVLAIFSRDLMKDKLGAVGVSGRNPADDDDDYTLE